MQAVPILGLREWIALPELGLGRLRAKIDTGARTSALHATDIEEFTHNDQRWVRFNAGFGSDKHLCQAQVLTCKRIKSSTGHVQERYVISTTLYLGAYQWPVEFTLTCRKTMRYPVLLGCRALTDGHWLVDPSQSYCHPKPLLPSNTPGAS